MTTTNKSTYRRNPDTLKKWTHSRRLYNDNETQSAGDSLQPERGADRAVTPKYPPGSLSHVALTKQMCVLKDNYGAHLNQGVGPKHHSK